LILGDLSNFIDNGERELNFGSESNSNVDEVISNWLEWFNEYPNDISQEELNEIKREIGEFMGSMSIWAHEEDERQEFINTFAEYFGEYEGFFKLVRDVYQEELKDEWAY